MLTLYCSVLAVLCFSIPVITRFVNIHTAKNIDVCGVLQMFIPAVISDCSRIVQSNSSEQEKQ